MDPVLVEDRVGVVTVYLSELLKADRFDGKSTEISPLHRVAFPCLKTGTAECWVGWV